MRYYSYTLSYPDKGIVFTINKEEIKKSDVLKSIHITAAFNGTLANGITIDHSTKGDIITLYGTPEDTTSRTYLDYSNIGIHFKFNGMNNAPSDTLVGIRIFNAYN